MYEGPYLELKWQRKIIEILSCED